MRVGSELLNICQEQVNLLTSGLGASFAIVALTERPVRVENSRDATFSPLITYPEALASVEAQAISGWLSSVWVRELENRAHDVYNVPPSTPLDDNHFADSRRQGKGSVLLDSSISTDQNKAENLVVTISEAGTGTRSPLVTSSKNQVVVSLVYQDVMVGILVTARMARGWNSLERYDIERVGKTLAASCVLDQRSQWLEQRLNQQSATYSQIQDHQQEVLDDVLHQFRNPLTAIRTFGKLLVKRLKPSDRNRTVAESVVRESDRLQDLLTQLSLAVQVPSLPGNPPEDLSVTTTLLIPGAAEQDDANSSASGLSDAEADLSGAEAEGSKGNSLFEQTTQPPEIPWVGLPSGGQETTVVSPTVPRSDTHDPLLDAGQQQEDAEQQDIVRALTGQTIQLMPHDPMDILEPLLFSAHAIAQERQIVLRLTCQDPRRPAMVDEKALREVLSNLIDNALKYTPEHGRVDVLVGLQSDEKGRQGIAIADTGPGIPLEDQAHLFERHFRGVQSQGSIPGTGLGLAIAQLLTRQMGGDISVFSPVERCPLTFVTILLEQVRHGQFSLDGSPCEDETPRLSVTKPIGELSEVVQKGAPVLHEWDDAVLWNKHGPGTLFIVWLPCE